MHHPDLGTCIVKAGIYPCYPRLSDKDCLECTIFLERNSMSLARDRKVREERINKEPMILDDTIAYLEAELAELKERRAKHLRALHKMTLGKRL